MRLSSITGLLAVALAGSAPAQAGLFSSTGPVIALVAGELFLGQAEGRLGGSGTLSIQSQARPEITCHGEFTYSSGRGDAGSLLCSDGATAIFKFQRLSLMRGHGTGTSSRGAMSFTYGLGAAESLPYLKLSPAP